MATPHSGEAISRTWWQRGVIYEIYPRSFQDSDGDGVGDLAGMIRRLDYLRWLGVDAIWLTPFYPSPMADFGYDVADYTGVDPLFGSLADADQLIAEAHRRGLKVILDFVPNHSSDRHPWFQEARALRDNPRRDWYVWRDPGPDGGPPNNWRSVFGGSAWTLDEATGQYYYHAYLKEQPDLNWRNADVQTAMFDVMRFWLDRGVDGFRIDALRQLVEDDQLRDNPANPSYQPGDNPYHAVEPVHTTDQPETHALVRRMREVADTYADRVLIGELYLPIKRLVAYYGEHGNGLHLPFNFHLILTPWKADQIAELIRQYEAALPPDGWPNWVLSNHDQQRLASRIGDAQARVAALLLLTLRGTPTLYYGDELGMRDVAIPPEQLQDPVARRVPGHGRDPERTPMQWDAGPSAGFTAGTPWLPVGEHYQIINVAAEREDSHSMLTLYRRALVLRRAHTALAIGTYGAIESQDDVLAYVREGDGQRWLIALNLSASSQGYTPAEAFTGSMRLSTHADREGETVRDTLTLRGDEGVVIQLDTGTAPVKGRQDG
ncbi:MAG: DUF3459 domain-containing protein [Chloroflexales bacterium]|nr:DUF3459 domain-containing protein [Chloroflexales bacterium]